MEREIIQLSVAVYLTLCYGCGASEMDRTLNAIRQVESSGGKDTADGDGGKAIGPYQIHRDYWRDGTQFLGVDWPYSDARDEVKARNVVRAYVQRYQRAYRQPATPEVWSKIHNGGPRGYRKTSTAGYWRRIQKAMK